MSEKTITLKIKGRLVKVRAQVYLHCDLIEMVYNRLIDHGHMVDIDYLFNNVVCKG